jgi:hypothetical protein
MRSSTPQASAVGEHLYRLASSGGYYARLKGVGKQFRRSLKTVDRKLAERRLADLRLKIGRLKAGSDATFEQVAQRAATTRLRSRRTS